MTLTKRIFYNTVAQSAGKILAIGIGLITVGLLSRYLAEAGFGQYSTILAYLGFFVVLADLGLYLFVVREISKPNTDHGRIISNALGLRLVIGLASLTAGSLLALVLPYDPIVKKTMFIGIAAFLFVLLHQVLIGIFQKHLVQYLTTLSEIAGRGLSLALIYWFIKESLPLPFFVLALVFGNAAIFILTLILARRFEKFSIAFDLSFWRYILSASWPLTFAIVLNLIYFKADTIILSLFHAAEAVGVYSLPYKILEVLLSFPAMFVGLVMPILARDADVSWDKFKITLQRSFDALLLAVLPMIITTQFFARPIIDVIKGQQEYADSPALLKILILATGIIFLGTLFGYAVVAVNKQRAMIKGYLAGALVGLSLYFLLIPKFGYWGAAWGTVATELVVASFAYYFTRQASKADVSLKTLARSLPAASALILFFYFVSLPWVTEIILGLGLYAALLVAFKAVPLEFIREVL